MAAEGRKGRLRRNGDAPMWADYEAAIVAQDAAAREAGPLLLALASALSTARAAALEEAAQVADRGAAFSRAVHKRHRDAWVKHEPYDQQVMDTADIAASECALVAAEIRRLGAKGEKP